MNQIITGAAIVVLAAGAFWCMNVAADRNETSECDIWMVQAKAFPSFYLTKWQDEQCRAHGIVIDAEVK